MIKVFCDRCGDPINAADKIGYITLNFKKELNGAFCEGNANSFEDNHFCGVCMRKILKFIRGDSMQEAPESEASIQTAPENGVPDKGGQEPKNGRRRIDIGKIMALRNAGWSIREIAEEMAMDPQSVSNTIYRYNKKVGNGKE